ncbi:MAG: glycosyltransferase [Terriglobia bacterium]|nr:glycosyltransferase [Terriglobia bacterium]
MAAKVHNGRLGFDELLNFYRRSRVQAVPSACFEQFPLLILEAMALGAPVIASRIGGGPTWWTMASPGHCSSHATRRIRCSIRAVYGGTHNSVICNQMVERGPTEVHAGIHRGRVFPQFEGGLLNSNRSTRAFPARCRKRCGLPAFVGNQTAP